MGITTIDNRLNRFAGKGQPAIKKVLPDFMTVFRTINAASECCLPHQLDLRTKTLEWVNVAQAKNPGKFIQRSPTLHYQIWIQ